MKTLILKRKIGLLAVVAITLNLLTSLAAFSTTAAAANFANPAFASTWQQLDGPVAAGKVQRPYLWGTPGPILDEPFNASTASGQITKRQVQYFDKGRMELTDPATVPTSPNYTGDGQLVRELVTGQLQIGSGRYLQYDAAEIPVSGDKTLAKNLGAPTYRAFRSLLLARISAVGKAVNYVLTPPEGEGLLLGFRSLDLDNALGSLSKYAVYLPETGHNIPDVFWNYLNQTSGNGEKLFNWADLFGLPLTDAYWTKIYQGGQPQDVLVQLYERRTLLYNPAAAPAQQVYAGDVGIDYYNWRYHLPEQAVYDSSVIPSENATVQPALGESGTTFNLIGTGFTPNETTSAWIDASGAEFPQNIKVDSTGGFKLHLRTIPIFTNTQKFRLVVIGNSSGRRAVFNLSIVNVLHYTPAVEAAQPSAVPASLNAKLSNSVIKVGGSVAVSATGFQVNEPLNGWITTPLNRVVSYKGLVSASGGDYPFTLHADTHGLFSGEIPAPGSAEPGVYAFTLQGTKSGAQAIVYFRVRAGSIQDYDPTWGLFDSFSSLAAPKLNFSDPFFSLDNLDLTKPFYQLIQD